VGFFKDLKRTVDKSKELQAQQPSVKDRMAAGIETMKAVNASMANTNAALDPSAPATVVEATVVAVRDAGMELNLQPVMAIDLLVPGPTGAVRPVSVTQAIPHSAMPRVQPGASIQVRVRDDDPQAVFLLV
jgi:hypothetical protein